MVDRGRLGILVGLHRHEHLLDEHHAQAGAAQENAGYIASFEALGGVAYGLSTLAGGYLFDRLRDAHFHVRLAGIELDHFAILFLVGAVTRALGVFWLARVPEPGAWRWREILAGAEQDAGQG